MKMKKIASLFLAGAMALSLAACGSSSTGSTSSAASTAASSTEEAASVAEAAGSVAEASSTTASTISTDGIKLAKDGTLRMATNATFPPYINTTDDGGFEGIDYEVAEEIANRLGLKLEVDDMDFPSILAAVDGGKDDIAMGGITVTDERKKSLNFSDSYATAVQVIIVKDGSDIQSVDDLSKAKAIGCQEGTTGYIYCSDSEENGGYGDKAIGYSDGPTAVQALVSGKVDAVVIDNEPAKEYVKANDGLKIIDTPFVEEEYAIGVNKDNDALLNAVNSVLKQMKSDGTLQKITDKYIKA